MPDSNHSLAPRRAILPGVLLASVVIFTFLAGRIYFIAGDDGTYIALAQSLRSGAYQAINAPGAPVQTQYPPLFPLLIAPVCNLPLGTVRLWVGVLSLGAAVAVIIAARLRDPVLGALGALPFLVSPLFGRYSTSILTETLHVALAYFVLVRVEERQRIGRIQFDWAIALGLAASLYLRTFSSALVAAVLGYFVWKRRFRAALATGAAVVFLMIPWWSWQKTFGGDYVQSHILIKDVYSWDSPVIEPSDLLVERAPYNLVRYFGRVAADAMLPPFFRNFQPRTEWFGIKFAGSVLISALALLGAARLIRRRGFAAEDFYVVATFGMLLAHPVFADRYLFPILPTLIGYLLSVFRNTGARRRLAVGWSMLSVIGIVFVLAQPVAREDKAYFEAIDWIAEHTRQDDVVLSRKPTAVWYHGGRVSTGYPGTPRYETWPRDFHYLIRDAYVIGIDAAEAYVDPVVKNTDCFEEVFVSRIDPEIRVFRHLCAPWSARPARHDNPQRIPYHGATIGEAISHE